jgi:hypothetical protein
MDRAKGGDQWEGVALRLLARFSGRGAVLHFQNAIRSIPTNGAGLILPSNNLPLRFHFPEEMEIVISNYVQTTECGIISPADQTRANGPNRTLEKRHLNRDQPNYVLLPLHLDPLHAILVIVLIQPLRLPDWPLSISFGCKIQESHVCCSASASPSWLPHVSGRVSTAIECFYPQVTVAVTPQLLSSTRWFQLPIRW